MTRYQELKEDFARIENERVEVATALTENEHFSQMYENPEDTIQLMVAVIDNRPIDELTGEFTFNKEMLKNIPKERNDLDYSLILEDDNIALEAFDSFYADVRMKTMQKNPEISSDVIDGPAHKMLMAVEMMSHSDNYRMMGAQNTGFTDSEYSKNLKSFAKGEGAEMLQDVVNKGHELDFVANELSIENSIEIDDDFEIAI